MYIGPDGRSIIFYLDQCTLLHLDKSIFFRLIIIMYIGPDQIMYSGPDERIYKCTERIMYRWKYVHGPKLNNTSSYEKIYTGSM